MAPRPSTTPYWLKWLMLVFIAYIAYTHFTGKDANRDVLVDNRDEAGGYTASRPADLGTSSAAQGYNIPGEIEGEGDPAGCGQRASVRVRGKRPDGMALELPADPQSVMVGVRSEEQPWAGAVTGMKVGGARQLTLYGRNLTETQRETLKLDKREAITYTLQLDALAPSPTPGHLSFRAMDLQVGTGTSLACGQTAELHLTLWNPDGSVAYASRDTGGPITMTVGTGERFYGLDRALVNMRVGGLRSAVIPPAYLARADASPDTIIPESLPRDRVWLADIQLLDVKTQKTEQP